MTWFLMNRSKNPINVEDGDKFNQAEWRTRNRLFKDVITRLHALPVDKVYFTFHLKDDKQFADLGNGSKGLMKVGEKPDWVDGTQRLASQQLFMGRYQRRADSSAGVYADKTLADGEFAIKARIEEVKGKGMDLVGQERTVLSVKDGKVVFSGIDELRW
jgi:transposase